MIEKIISGGQTGADRAGLDAAIELGIPHGGWCPKGRRAEDGKIDDKYNLLETTSTSYDQRTRNNAKESDGTVVICSFEKRNSPGTVLTMRLLKEQNKPFIMFFTNGDIDIYKQALADYIKNENIKVLNVAGNRESVSPGVYKFAKQLIIEAINVLNAPKENFTI